MSKESQNFLQRAMQAYTDYNPFGANERAEVQADQRQVDRNEYLEDQFVDRLDPLKPERGVKPSFAESVLLGVKRDDFKDAGGRINVRNLKKTDDGEKAQRLGIEIKPNYNPSQLKSAVERKVLENEYSSLSTKDENINLSELSDTALNEQLRIAKNRRDEIEKYGTPNTDGTRSGGSVVGSMELSSALDALATSKSARNVNEGTLAINQVTARNAQTQQDYRNKRNEFEYADSKVEAEIARKFLAAQQAAQYDADYKTIQLQNAAEMERYEMMLQNDREVRRGDKISDLIASLFLFGGTMG